MARETTERSFDELARGLAEGSISRRRALGLFASSAVAALLPSTRALADDDHDDDGYTICHVPGTPPNCDCTRASTRRGLSRRERNRHLKNHPCDSRGNCRNNPYCGTTTTTTTSSTTTTSTTTPTTSTSTSTTSTSTTTEAPTTTTSTTTSSTTTTPPPVPCGTITCEPGSVCCQVPTGAGIVTPTCAPQGSSCCGAYICPPGSGCCFGALCCAPGEVCCSDPTRAGCVPAGECQNPIPF